MFFFFLCFEYFFIPYMFFLFSVSHIQQYDVRKINYIFEVCYIILMGTIGLFRQLVGRTKYFLPVFAQQATYLQHASRSLCEMMDTMSVADWNRLERDIKACEVQGDALLTELHEQLSENFISKIRKIDIQVIAMSIDELLDHINDAAKSFHLYNPDRIDSQLSDLAQYLQSQTDSIKRMVALLGDLRKNYSQIAVQCERITELEHAADDTYEEYIGFIFKNEKDPIQVIKYKNIAEMLEAATDAAKRVSDNVRKIILKYME